MDLNPIETHGLGRVFKGVAIMVVLSIIAIGIGSRAFGRAVA